MKPEKILFIDTETGGLNPDIHSLLSIAFAVWDNGKVIATKEFFINDGFLNVTKEAIKINGIDIELHSKEGTPPEQTLSEIEIFLLQYFDIHEKVVLCGHNVFFDLGFLKKFWANNNRNFGQRFSHRYIDTASILYYLYIAGKLPYKVVSSQEAFDYFKIHVDKRHSALGDVLATVKLFQNLIRL